MPTQAIGHSLESLNLSPVASLRIRIYTAYEVLELGMGSPDNPQESSEVPSFRPRRALLGYERRATDRFLEQVAEIVRHANERLHQAENELAAYRDKERLLHEALLSVAKVADSIRHEAGVEEEAIRADARELATIVERTRSRLTTFMRETLESVARVTDEIETYTSEERLEDDAFRGLNLPDELRQAAAWEGSAGPQTPERGPLETSSQASSQD
jgi:DivIVA protein